jgi:glycerol-3-phosphate dehydrogenase
MVAAQTAMGSKGWRSRLWSQLQAKPQVDVLVVGGGITGVGVFREAARAGLRVLLVEQADFASGTSSRSSKMVHGGLRYLSQYHFGLTRDSVKERERLSAEAPGLVNPALFMYARYEGEKPKAWEMKAGLWLYDLVAGKRTRQYLNAAESAQRTPYLRRDGLDKGYMYQDAATDDSRLVFRMVQEGSADGGYALNRCAVGKLLRRDEQVVGAVLHDSILQQHLEIEAAVVINATGVQVDRLRSQLGGENKIRPVRGSHIIIPHQRLPLDYSVSYADPIEGKRPMFVYPWEGVTVIGITDMEHDGALDEDAAISKTELELILQGANRVFPEAALTSDDIICSYSGVRPLVDDGTDDPTEAPRHHEVWQENGLITVTGGKLTTFRLTAVDALNKARKQLLQAGLAVPKFRSDQPIVVTANVQQPDYEGLKNRVWQRLSGRYGNAASDVLAAAKPCELELIDGTHFCLAELRWAARAEMVETLADILLRRTRVGMLLPAGAKALWPQVEKICAEELSWDKARWQQELADYQAHYQQYYGLPAE